MSVPVKVSSVALRPTLGFAVGRLWLRGLLTFLWLGCFAAVIYVLLHINDRIEIPRGAVLARLENVHGAVRMRTETSILWEDILPKQDLRKGDVVATGPGSRVTLTFTNGRQIELGPNSMIGIELNAGANSFTNHLSLELLKGQVSATVVRAKPQASDTFEAILTSIGAKTAPEAPVLTIQAAGKTFVAPPEASEPLTLRRDPTTQAVVTVPPKQVAQEAAAAAKLEAPVAKASTNGNGAALTNGLPTSSQALEKPSLVAPKVAMLMPKLSLAPAFDLAPPHVEPLVAPKLVVRQRLATMVPAPVAPPPPPPVDPMTFVPELALHQGAVMFTGISLARSCSSASDLSFGIFPRGGVKAPDSWRPFLEFAATGAAPLRLLGTGSFSRQTVKLPMATLCAALASTRRDVGMRVDLRAGNIDGNGQTSLAPTATRLVLASVVDFPDKEMTLHFDKLTPRALSPRGWLDFVAPKPEHLGAYAIRVPGGRVLAKLWRLMAGDGKITISNLPLTKYKTQVNFSDKAGLIATVGAPSMDRDGARKIARELNAETAFIGNPNSYVRLPLAIKARLNIVEGYLREDEEIQLLVRDRVIKVTLADLQEDIQSTGSLAKSASAIYRKGTTVILP